MQKDFLDDADLPLDQLSAYGLVRRSDLWSRLIRRDEEESIARVVPVDFEWLANQKEDFIGDRSLTEVLNDMHWQESDLDLHLHLPEALKRFALSRFGPGLEEEFLSAKGGHDQIMYSLIRCSDLGLVQELWIRLEESEANFFDVAEEFGEGPEAKRKGLIGPIPVGQLQPPELAVLLRSLKVGEVHPPISLGDWHVLVRLESLQPARFDENMRTHLLDMQLHNFLEERVQLRLRGEVPERLAYDPIS